MGNKKDISKHIKAFQLLAQDIMNDTAVSVDERIQRTADIYQQAEKLAEEDVLGPKPYESLLTDSSRFYAEHGMYKESIPRYQRLIELRESLYGQAHTITATAYHDIHHHGPRCAQESFALWLRYRCNRVSKLFHVHYTAVFGISLA